MPEGQMYDTRAFRRLPSLMRSWGTIMSNALAGVAPRAAVVLLTSAKAKIPRKTGKTAGKLKAHLTHGLGRVRVEITGDKVAMWLITGTKAHEIRPRRASALRWVDHTGEHFATRVQHPGTKGKDWRRPAMAMAKPQLIALGNVAVRTFATKVRTKL